MRVHIADKDFGASLEQLLGNGPADTFGSSSDETDFAIELHFSDCLMSHVAPYYLYVLYLVYWGSYVFEIRDTTCQS